MTRRTATSMAMAVLCAVGITIPVLAAPSTAGAAARVAHSPAVKAGSVNASGTLACSVSKGKVVVAPGLRFGGTATSATFTFSGKLACTGSSGVKGGTFTATGTSASNDCGILSGQGIPTMTMTATWKGKFNPSTIVFSDGNFSIGSAITIKLPSTGPNPPVGTTSVSGSFAFEPVSASFLADQTITAFAAACNDQVNGLTGFTATGVNGPSTLDIDQSQTVVPPAPPPSTPVTVGVDGSSPGAAVNENLVGVNHIVAGSQSAMAAIGTAWARTDASFEVNQGTSQAAYNCTTGSWNPSYLDGNIAIDKAAGAQPELIVDYFPSCLDYQLPGRTSAQVSTEMKAWKALVYQMALHEITAEGVRVFEVWNEPSFYMGLNGKFGYLTLYKNTVIELEAAANAAKVSIEVGGPGVDELGQIDNSWISGLLAYVAKYDLPLNFISWHQYPNDPDEGPQAPYPSGICQTGAGVDGQPCWYNPDLDVSLFARGARSVESLLSSYPTLHPVLWVDEWGVDSGTDARLSGPYGAAFVAASLDSAQQGGIGRMAFYDTADGPTSPTYDAFGLLTFGLTPKPAYYAFALWHQLAGSLLPVTLTPDQSASGPVGQIGAVASKGPGGTVKVLVYDFAPYDPTGAYGTTDPTPYDHQVTVDLAGLATGTYATSRALIDAGDLDTSVATTPISGPSGSITFTLAGEGVTLLTLTPGG